MSRVLGNRFRGYEPRTFSRALIEAAMLSLCGGCAIKTALLN